MDRDRSDSCKKFALSANAIYDCAQVCSKWVRSSSLRKSANEIVICRIQEKDFDVFVASDKFVKVVLDLGQR